MKFNLRIQEGNRFYNDCFCYYYIGTNNTELIERVQSLSPVCIYGDKDFKTLRKAIRAEFKKEQTPQLEMTSSLKRRFSDVENKIEALIMPGESIYRMFFHYNREMSKPMVIVCLGVRTGDIAGIEQGRVIVSGVNTIIEKNHFVHSERCDYYEGQWNYITSKNGKDFINIDCTKQEKPIAFRGKK